MREPGADDRVEVTDLGPFAFDLVVSHDALELFASGAHDARDALVVGLVEALGQMGRVDDEAGVAPRGAIAGAKRLEQHDARVGKQLAEPPGGWTVPPDPAEKTPDPSGRGRLEKVPQVHPDDHRPTEVA